VLRIKLTSPWPHWPYARQTPGGRGEWGDAKFLIEEFGAGADWWIVYSDLLQEETVECGAGKTALITTEPPACKTYDRDFAAQFDWVITQHRALKHPRKIYSHPALPWEGGRVQIDGKNVAFSKSYDELKTLWPISKIKLVSVISSTLSGSPGHRDRLAFVQRLQKHFGERLDVFGRGLRAIPDKWDAIAPYRYHITIENSVCPDYWTEKLSDAFLAGAYPIYHGAPNVFDYFPKSSLTQIDIRKPESAIAQIEAILGSDTAEKAPLLQAREYILEQANLFPFLVNFCSARQAAGEPSLLRKTLRPASAFYKAPTLTQRAIWKIKRTLGIR
jgi:hypothetical protein